MKTYKLTKQNVLQRVKDAEQSSLNVIEPITASNLNKLTYELRRQLFGGINVSIIVVPAAKEDM
jgi:hypothetical protein